MLDTLTSLIRIPSVTSDLLANQTVVHWCQQHLTRQNIDSTIISSANRPLLIWGAPLFKTQLLVNTHLDVVPGSQSIFTPRKSGTRLLGRGAADSKAFAAIMLHLPPIDPQKITFTLCTDEEIGGESTKLFLPSLPKLKFAVFGEPTNLRLVNQAKGMMQIKITAHGAASHGSKPWAGTNAIELLLQNMHAFIASHPTPTKETLATTFNFSLISGGQAINVVPDACELQVDVRFNPKDSPAKITKLLTTGFPDCRITILKSEPPISTSPNNTFLKLFPPLDLVFEHSTSDARHCTALDIPTVVFGPTGGDLHQDTEWLDIPSLIKTQDILISFLKKAIIKL